MAARKRSHKRKKHHLSGFKGTKRVHVAGYTRKSKVAGHWRSKPHRH